MSTISQTPKIKVARISENRVLILVLAAVCLAMMAALIASSAVPNASGSFDQNAYTIYRQGEWLSLPVHLTNAEAYQIYRQGEWASAGIPVTAGDLSAYHLSERTLVNPAAGLVIYQLSERTMVDPQAGMAIYHSSERTSLPAQFNPYQRSEWFGE